MPGHVVVPLVSADKAGIIAELARRLVDRAGGDYDDVYRAVMRREQELSTGIGFGVAIPHGKSPTLAELRVVAGVSDAPVPFDALDGRPVRLFFMSVGPEAAAGQHIKVLGRIARLVRHEGLREQLLSARTAEEFQQALLLAEER